MDYFKRLPSDITSDILSRVPTELILECKSVCKTWRNLIRRPSFSKIHLHRLHHPSNSADSSKLGFLALTMNELFYYFEYNDDQNNESTPIERFRRIDLASPFTDSVFVGSCNGLVCLARKPIFGFAEKTYICNPITRECVMLPAIKTDLDIDEYIFWTSGFGFVSSTNEYKVVRVYKLKSKLVEVHIYTLGSGCGWRNLGKLNSNFRADLCEQGKFANEVLYWTSSELEGIVTFDLAEEKFCEDFSTPPLPPEGDWFESRIGVLDGFLYFEMILLVGGVKCFDLWFLKKKIDNHEHPSLEWSREFRIDESELLTVTKNDGILTYIDNYFSIYDTKASTSKRLVEFEEEFYQIIPHKKTLVSLKNLGEEDTEVMESVGVEEAESRVSL